MPATSAAISSLTTQGTTAISVETTTTEEEEYAAIVDSIGVKLEDSEFIYYKEYRDGWAIYKENKQTKRVTQIVKLPEQEPLAFCLADGWLYYVSAPLQEGKEIRDEELTGLQYTPIYTVQRIGLNEDKASILYQKEQTSEDESMTVRSLHVQGDYVVVDLTVAAEIYHMQSKTTKSVEGNFVQIDLLGNMMYVYHWRRGGFSVIDLRTLESRRPIVSPGHDRNGVPIGDTSYNYCFLDGKLYFGFHNDSPSKAGMKDGLYRNDGGKSKLLLQSNNMTMFSMHAYLGKLYCLFYNYGQNAILMCYNPKTQRSYEIAKMESLDGSIGIFDGYYYYSGYAKLPSETGTDESRPIGRVKLPDTDPV